VFNPPPPDSSDQTSKQQPANPDLGALFILWLFYFAIGPVIAPFGFSPPAFKPRWLYKGFVASGIALWIGIVISVWILSGPGQVETWLVITVMLLLIGEMAYVLLTAGDNAGIHRRGGKKRHPV
jgi:hypothetical protein